MSLRDYVIPTRTVTIKGDNKMSIRALGFDDIQHLLINRQGLIQTALDLFSKTGLDASNASDADVRSFAASLLATLPDLVAELIAVAADEPDQASNAKRLAAPVQLEALMGVYELTFAEPDSVKKFFDRLADLMTSIPRPGKAVNVESLASLRAGLSASGATLAS